MNITLTHVKKFIRSPNGIIIKVIEKKQRLESIVTKFKKGRAEGYLLRYKSEDLLILVKNRINTVKSQYRRILYDEKDLLIEKDKDLNLSHLTWIKHPLLDEEYLKKHDRNYVLNSWAGAF